jgi:hypothetical protein
VTARGKLLSARCLHQRAFWYRVNHLLLSLCRCHARQMAARRGITVEPDAQSLIAFAQH